MQQSATILVFLSSEKPCVLTYCIMQTDTMNHTDSSNYPRSLDFSPPRASARPRPSTLQPNPAHCILRRLSAPSVPAASHSRRQIPSLSLLPNFYGSFQNFSTRRLRVFSQGNPSDPDAVRTNPLSPSLNFLNRVSVTILLIALRFS
jgi:hypothetical protein